jgi:hypothetical protein
MQPTTIPNRGHRGVAGADALPACNVQIEDSNELRRLVLPQPELAPAPPIVAGTLLSGDEISFFEFLNNGAAADYCTLLLGSNGTAAAKMIEELRKATEFHYFGYWRSKPRSKNAVPSAGKLTANVATKQFLKKYARRAYRGDTERRGVIYWERVAWLVWDCYAALMTQRRRAERIKQQENKRIARLPAKRAERTEYMRTYRAKQRAIKGAQAAHFTTNEAKERWRPQRKQTRKGDNQ